MKNLILKSADLFFIGILVVLLAGGYIFYGLLACVLFVVRGGLLKKGFFSFIIVALLIAGTGYYRIMMPLPSGESAPAVFRVSRGMTTKGVAVLLSNHHLIRHPDEFRLLARWFQLDRRLKAGRYTIPRGTSLIQVLEILSEGRLTPEQITIPEGLIIEETAARFQKICGVDSAEFVRLCRDADFIRSLGLGEKTLEGYLYPDTYQFAWGTSAPVVIKKMITTFQSVYKKIHGGSPFINKYSCHQIVTMASIVERESGVDHERPHIAGVFWNRVRIGMKLGADPTVRYAIRKFTGPLRVSELNCSSPYNTRKYAGIPPGPICNPGYKAIYATLFPLSTKDLYFVAKEDGSGEHYFTRTLKDHNAAKIVARKTLRNRKR